MLNYLNSQSSPSMAFQTVLFCTLLTLSTTLSQDHACCSVKVVTGTGELGMDGVYTYSQTNQGRYRLGLEGNFQNIVRSGLMLIQSKRAFEIINIMQ